MTFIHFLSELRDRNELLFYFGMINLLLGGLFILLGFTTSIEVAGTNAWYKPTKFALSIGIYSLTMGWLMHYLPQTKDITIINWLIIIMLGLEIFYIGIQAGRGQLSHFNQSTPLYSSFYALMAVAATAISMVTLYVAIRFFQLDFPNLPDYYVWAIRLSLILFFVFSMEGYLMGANLSHTIGGPDGGEGLPFLNWSRTFGDPRVAHFIGMHAIQVLPLLSFYVLRDVKLTIAAAALYTALAVYVLVQALKAKSLFPI